MKLRKQLAIGGLALVTAFSTYAQDEPAGEEKSSGFLNTLSVGGALGLSLAHSDLRVYDWYPVASYDNERSLGGYLHLTKSLSPVFSVQGQLLFAGAKGTNRDYGLSSSAQITEGSLNVHVNISNLVFSNNKGPRKFALYGYAGLGLSSFRSYRYVANTETNVLYAYGYDANNLDQKADATVETVVPVGFGVKYRLTDNISAFGEISGRMLNSDKLDAYIAGDAKDSYSLTALGITYAFGDQSNSEEWTDPLETAFADLDNIKADVEALSKDSDGDGVSDKFDKEAGTPEGAVVDGAGRAMDIDGDGIPDHMDDEISSRGAKVDENGKEIDTDGDGVPDSKDLEPNTEKGKLVNFQGVTIQVEESTASAATPAGLPSVYFPLNSTTVSYNNYPALAEVAQALKANDKLKLTVVGHTDASGSASYNEKLGMRRAQSVIDHLVKVYGIDASRLTASSKGKSELLAKGSASNINRRVDFVISK